LLFLIRKKFQLEKILWVEGEFELFGIFAGYPIQACVVLIGPEGVESVPPAVHASYAIKDLLKASVVGTDLTVAPASVGYVSFWVCEHTGDAHDLFETVDGMLGVGLDGVASEFGPDEDGEDEGELF